jgi:hypothetical protein
VDPPGHLQGAAVGDPHGVGEPAPDHLVDAHLGHLGAAGQAHLDAGDALAAGQPAGDHVLLDRVRPGHVEGGAELRDGGGVGQRPVEDGGVVGHGFPPARSRATSTIMSS